MPGPIINNIPDFTGNPGDNGDFNNKAKYIATTILPREVEYPYFEMTEQINRLRTFTIGRDEQGVAMLHYRKSVNGTLQSYHATMLFTPGAGIYGKDATPVNQSDFLIISNTFANPLTDLNANFIDLGEIGDAAVHQFIINSGFVFDVKQQETNYFRALRNGIDHTYIFSNRIEQYPQAGELLEVMDFELLAKGGDLISGTEGNNKAKYIATIILNREFEYPYFEMTEQINRLRTFTIGRDEQGVAMLHYRKNINGILKSYHATMLFTPGAGTYGKDATPVNQSDFLIINNVFANPLTDINANFIDLGEIGEATVHQFIIDSGFNFSIKQQETNYFRALREGIDHTYIYSNRIERYPQAAELLKTTDFELLAQGGKPLNDPTIPENLSQLNDDIGATDLKTILVRDKAQIVNQVLNPDRTYKIAVPALVLGAGDSIIVPAGGLIIKGYGFNVTSIVQPNDNGVIYTSPEGGSGNLNLIHLNSVASGENGRVFDVVDVDGSHEVGFNSVNFSGCKSLGIIDGYRQGTANDMGIYGCSDGLTRAGAWNGFKIESTNVFGFGAAGTLFKKAADTSFSNRLFINVNIDFPMGAVLCDFDTTNFKVPELFQINSSIAKVDGIIDIDAAGWLLPNISANDIKSLWVGNIGLPDTATELLTENDDVNGVFEIDWLKDTYFLRLTGNTTFTQKNLPANTKNTQEIRLYVTGDFIPTFPLGWNANLVGTYKGADVNEIAIKYIRDGLYFVRISNTLTVYPAPRLGTVIPAGLLPLTTAEVILNGSFFTPQSVVKVQGQTVNSTKFNDDTGALELSLTTGEQEDDFDIAISNGTNVIFKDKLTVALGEVFTPETKDWINISNAEVVGNSASIGLYQAENLAEWDIVMNKGLNFSVSLFIENSPLGAPLSQEHVVNLFGATTGNNLFSFYRQGGVAYRMYDRTTNLRTFTSESANPEPPKLEIRNILGLGVQAFVNNVFVLQFETPLQENLRFRFNSRSNNIRNVKYIELAT